jgi:putative ABC transport system permease protein
MLSFRLALNHLALHGVRTALTVAAIALAVSLIVSISSAYASIEAAAMKFMSQVMSQVDAQITRRHDARGGVPASLLAELRDDPAVAQALGRLEVEMPLLDENGKPLAARPALVIGLERPADRRVENLKLLAGAWFDQPEGDVAVIDQMAARVIRDVDAWRTGPEGPSVGLGETIQIAGADGPLRLQVVGIVHKPGILASAIQTIYLPLNTLRRFVAPDQRDALTRIWIDLQTDSDQQAFKERWTTRLAAIDPSLRLRLTRDARSDLERNILGLRIMSFLGGTIAMLAACFIIFSALSMGVSERRRVLALLRAVGMERGHVGSLVLVEAILLAAAGTLIGIPLGLLWVHILASIPMFQLAFSDGVVASRWGIIFAGVCAVLAAALASILPALSAMRTRPLDALATVASAPTNSLPWISFVTGVFLIALDPLFVFAPWPRWIGAMLPVEDPISVGRSFQFYSHFIVGLPALMLGFFLIAPMLVLVIERTAGRLVAALLGIKFELLRQHVSGALWRSAGTAAALMVGLAVLIVLQTQGRTVVGGWKIPTKFPDMFIFSGKFGGLNAADQQKLMSVPGIVPGQAMPIAIASPELGAGFWAIAGAAVMPNATMFFGIDPDIAFDLMELDFRDGNAEDARRMLKLGRHLIVTEEFRQLRGIKTGDTIELNTPRHGMVPYTVAGVVWSPGIDVIVSMQDLGTQLDQRTAASLFGTLDDARKDFGVESIYLFAANLEPGVDRDTLVTQIRTTLGVMGLQAGDVRQIKAEIRDQIQNLLLMMSAVSLAAMLVASLGVANTVMASVRSRRWVMGILRSVGAERSVLLRIVLAEAVLLGVAGAVLGTGAGLLLAIDARKLMTVIVGYAPPQVIPWGIVAMGMGAVLLVSVLAALLPARLIARAEPLELLQAGRAAT